MGDTFFYFDNSNKLDPSFKLLSPPMKIDLDPFDAMTPI